jgi:multidrug transporter EmrE-like cation transporter
MNKTHQAVLLMIVCTIFTSVGQILLKFGVDIFDKNHVLSLFNVPLILGFFAYVIGAMLMLAAFRVGELSVIYPIIATSYVWVSLISPLLFPDVMNVWKWLGVLTILLSVTILGFSGRKEVASFG